MAWRGRGERLDASSMSAADSLCRQIGPFSFQLRTSLTDVRAQMAALYARYPQPPGGADDFIAEFRIAVEPTSLLRRFVRPQIAMLSDLAMPIFPLHRRLGPVGFEMAMNWHVAMGMHRLLLLHASCAEASGEGGRGALIFSGESGSGKSTLAAALGFSGWRLLGDEFVLVDPQTGLLQPFPRPISLKNRSIDVMAEVAGPERLSARFTDTPKGTIAYLAPPDDAIAAMHDPARPVGIVFPAFRAGAQPQARQIRPSEAFVRLASSSTNYHKIGGPAFEAVWTLASLPAFVISYGSTEDGQMLARQILDHCLSAGGKGAL